MCYCSINAHFTNYDQYLSSLYALKSNTEQLISSSIYAKKLTQLSQLTCIIHVRYNCTYTLYVFQSYIPPTIWFSRLSLLMEKAFLEDVKIRRSNMIIRYMHVVYILLALTFLAGNSNIECSFFMAINPIGFFFNESNIDSREFLSYITWLHLCGVKGWDFYIF